jgi:hypothetical protein
MGNLCQNCKCPKCLPCTVCPNHLDDDGKNGIEARVWYLNIVSILMLALSALIFSVCNVDVDTDLDGMQARFENCALSGAVNGTGCVSLVGKETETDVMKNVNTLSLVLIILNSATLLIGIMAHFQHQITKMHFMAQALLSVTQLGLFAGIVGWMNASSDVTNADNMQFNDYLAGVNIYIVAVSGLTLSILEPVIFFASLNYYFNRFRHTCSVKALEDYDNGIKVLDSDGSPRNEPKEFALCPLVY